VTVALVLAALLAVACVLGVALPFLREPEPASDLVDALSERQRATLELAETRDRAVEALRELESDHRGGRVSDVDYRALVGPLRAEVAAALRALDSAEGRGSSDPDANIA
jgi:hypothetical protein